MTDPRELAQRIFELVDNDWWKTGTREKVIAILAAEMPRWVPCAEKLPELKEIYTNSPKKARVLVYNSYHVMEGWGWGGSHNVVLFDYVAGDMYGGLHYLSVLIGGGYIRQEERAA